ncbi:MAG: hypothetical protein KA177_06710 [Paludibacter sp.]|jgi:hypothetical protein|nr:hypothetical protein [Paludibacter sp.]
MENKLKSLKKLLLLPMSLFAIILFQFCTDKITYDNIEFQNESDIEVFAQFTKSNQNKESIKMSTNGSYSGFTLFTYENDNDGIDSTTFINEVKKLKIFKIQGKDTIYVEQSKYNSMKNWKRYVSYDMGTRYNQYIVTIKNDMFESK